MGDVVNFKPTRKVKVSVCDGNQNYQTFDADSFDEPTLEFEQYEVWWGDEKVHIAGSHNWTAAKITGPKDIGDAIRYGEPPVRVTFEYNPRTTGWWELHEAYLSTESIQGVDPAPSTHVIRFRTAKRHEYD